MRSFLGTLVTVLVLSSCAGKKTESRQAEQPSEVAGGFGLTMQCSVLNRNAADSASSSVGCLVFNDDGTPYGGSITNTSAEFVTTSGKVIKSAQIITGPNAANYSILVEASDLKPSETATIRVSATFDGRSFILVSSLKEFATICTQDMNLFVDSAAPATNRACTSSEKCRTMTQALAMIPDIITCKITIDVAKGVYQESINLTEKSVRKDGVLKIQGVPKRDGGGYDTILTNDVSSSDSLSRIRGFVLAGFSTESKFGALHLANLKLEGRPSSVADDPPITAIQAHSSAVLLENVEISNYSQGISSPSASVVRLKNVTIKGAKVGFSARDLIIFSLSEDIVLSGLDKTDASSRGIFIDGCRDFQSSHRGIPLKSLTIDNFHSAIFLADTSVNFKGGETVTINNVHKGITLFEGSTISFPKTIAEGSTDDSGKPVNPVPPVELSIKNITGHGIYLSESSFDDGLKGAPQIKHSLVIDGNPDTPLIWAANNSRIDLKQTDVNFCFKSFNSSLDTVWSTSANPSSYAFVVDRDSDASLTWSENPFKFGSACSSTDIAKRPLHVKTWKYRFKTSTVCPAGYTIQNEGIESFCYAGFGRARYWYPRATMPDVYFGALQSDSRIDDKSEPFP